ncbi:hypothetical protein BHE74_00019307 [Ensete ventricosum]|uniref:Uncharacterized protein n=1 Tax=Ensete ventricosum TaxID=4639 RepID=A0A426YD76_ENSVE|nr:hypothetical protein B296_00052200 [Ensete ventricosum]RWW34131.1 hypothetical protein GW17_00001117 [Ensete ventricosum]RWW72855.1 hypothetical protein BHE74_00019307 [Ensete ventricosum]RZS25011.1 hypothetical protein BHM03_00058161 [Ensete ventricosum]
MLEHDLLPPAAPSTALIQRGDPSSSSSSSSSRPETLDGDADLDRKWTRRPRFPVSTRGTCAVLKRERKAAKKVADGKASLGDHVRAWKEKRMIAGVSERECFLPFLTNAPRMVICACLALGLLNNLGYSCSLSWCT